mmetsp:Transcript_1571/g.9676  ORF Transcript_1571/g.9676 Transcript_1571/m.9676 type:complete len:467 (+) Transcript_1571:80-1480(+)
MEKPRQTGNLPGVARQEEGTRNKTGTESIASNHTAEANGVHVWAEQWVADVQPPAYAVQKPKVSKDGSRLIPVGGLLSMQAVKHDGEEAIHVAQIDNAQKHQTSIGKEDPPPGEPGSELYLERKIAWIMLISRFAESLFALVAFIVMANSEGHSTVPSFQAILAAGVIAFFGCMVLGCTEWLFIGVSYDDMRGALTKRLMLLLTDINCLYDLVVGFLCLGCCCASAGILTSNTEGELLCENRACSTEVAATTLLFFTAFILMASFCLSFWKYRRHWMNQLLQANVSAEEEIEDSKLTWTHNFGLRVFIRSLQVALAVTSIGIYSSLERRDKVHALQFSLAVSVICMACSLCLAVLDGYCISNKLNSYPHWFKTLKFIALVLLYDVILCCLSLASASATSGAFFGECSIFNFDCAVVSAGLAMSWLQWLTFFASIGMSWRDFEKSTKVSIALRRRQERCSADDPNAE